MVKRQRRSFRAVQKSVPRTPTVRAFLARQPILDTHGKVLGYQLLFRDNLVNMAHVVDPDRATATVILNALVDMGIDRVVGEFRMFIEFPKQTLLDDYSSLLPSERVVLQVAADTEPSIPVVAAVSSLRWRGYKIALSKFVRGPEVHPLLALSDYVKFDVLATPIEELKGSLRLAREAGAVPIANKVETYAQYRICRELGFEYFQGYYLADPQILADKRPDASTRVLELLRALNEPGVTIDQLDEIVRSDVLLSYRLLRCLNSAAFGVPQRIRNVRHALVMMGTENLRKWAVVLAMTANADKPVELMRIALIRAQMCANLAPAAGCDAKALFTVGLFSVLDALLDRPMSEIIETLGLSEEISRAILRGEGQPGEVLRCVVAYERADWKTVDESVLGLAEITSAWFRALEWADGIVSEVGDSLAATRPV